MKSIVVLLTTLCMLSSFTSETLERTTEITSSAMLGQHVIKSLQRESADEFAQLLPGLGDFYRVMDQNASFYGQNLSEAKADFAREYSDTIIPGAKKAFAAIIREGKEKGINWKQISFVTVKFDDSNHKGFTAPVTVVFSHEAKQYTIHLRRALVFGNEWRVSQYISLI